MTTTICIIICSAMVITSIVEFTKPAFQDLVKKKYLSAICIAISFILWLIAAFSFNYWLDLTIGAKILLWLWLGTGATIWYDVWKVVQEFTSTNE